MRIRIYQCEKCKEIMIIYDSMLEGWNRKCPYCKDIRITRIKIVNIDKKKLEELINKLLI